MTRPYPPAMEASFIPATELAEWAFATFIAEDGKLANPDHEHLQAASIGMLWTTTENTRAMRRVVGQAEIGAPRGAKWPKGRAEQQLEEWFGDIPDFLLTFDAGYASQCSDAEFCALVEHELYHASQGRDDYGMPKFTREGRPVFEIRGHDVEEFVGVVRRYGAEAAGVQALVAAAARKPEVAVASISHACGTCLRIAA